MSRRKKFRALVPRNRQSYYPSIAVVYDEANETRAESSLSASISVVPYDENLLERSRTQWQLGDWSNLAQLDPDTLHHHPDRAKLALLAAAGHLQNSCHQTAKQFIRLAQDWGCSKKLISEVLVSGVYNGLGRAALILGQNQRALTHFKTSAATANQRVDTALWGETIALREGLRLGLLPQAATQLGMPAPALNASPKPPDVGITSYAQNFEDVMLWRALGRVENGFYIDVGAQLPVFDSVSKAFYEHGWRGVHVEPVAAYAEAIRQDRPDERVFECILAALPGTQVFFQIPGTGISTGRREIAARHRNSGFEVHEVSVQTSTLAAVFDEVMPRDIHWLKIDVEGMEDAVLAGWVNHPARPWIVVIESTEPLSQVSTWHEWECYLLDRDYAFVYFDGLNRFYIHAAHLDLTHFFSTPPNVFDNFNKN